MGLLADSIAGSAFGCSYDSVAALRDADVVSNFDASKMEGFWYEHSFQDPAQVGASCQTLNCSYNAQSGELVMPFSVIYGKIPFTIEEHYAPREGMKGVWRKSVKAPFGIPGGSLVGLSTSAVSAKLSADGSRYESVILYSCLSIVTEIMFATRSPTISDADYQAMVDELKAKKLSTSGLRRVDWTKCDKP